MSPAKLDERLFGGSPEQAHLAGHPISLVSARIDRSKRDGQAGHDGPGCRKGQGKVTQEAAGGEAKLAAEHVGPDHRDDHHVHGRGEGAEA